MWMLVFAAPVVPMPVLLSTAALAAPAPAQAAAKTLTPEQIAAALAPRTIGHASAPVVFTEYSSLSCGHCARFHADTLPALKQKYVDTGRVHFVYVDFPTNAPALDGAMAARCASVEGENAIAVAPSGYFEILENLFSTQNEWAFTRAWREKLSFYSGLKPGHIDVCLASPGLRAGIVARVEAAQEAYGINATPAFVIEAPGREAVVIRGNAPLADFEAALDAALDDALAPAPAAP